MCVIKDCPKPAKAKGLCSGHYQQQLPKKAGCRSCGEPTERWHTYCDPCGTALLVARERASQKEHHHRSNHRKRARHYGVAYEPVDRRKVYARDGWVCQICGQPVDPTLKYPDLMSVSLDHRVAMAKGGGHVYSNVQTSHFMCNSEKRELKAPPARVPVPPRP